MGEPSSTTLAEPEAYTGCPHCTPCHEYYNSLDRLRPLPPDAVSAVDPDGVDWNEYYWGHHRWPDNPSERRTIARPLPQSITDRIPLELFEHILGFLRWETKDLYNCALVCRAWHHHSQHLLYSRVVVGTRAAYDAVVRASAQNRKSTQYLRLACASMFEFELRSEALRNHFSPASVALGRSLPCLCIRHLDRPPYHSSLALQFSCFSTLVHLELVSFKLNTFTDFRHIICGLKNLRELTLSNGSLVSSGRATNGAAGFPPVKAPHLSRVSLLYLDQNLFSKLAQWIASTEICNGCRDLFLMTGSAHPWDEGGCDEFLRKLGPSLTSFVCVLNYPQPWQHLGGLASCTRLSTVKVAVEVNHMDSWQGLVTALREILSRFSSPVMRNLHLDIWMRTPKDSPSTSTHPDREFWTLDLGSIHDVIKRPLFNSLRDASIELRAWSLSPSCARLTCDTVLTAEELARRVYLILEPWDKRGILTVEGYNEATDEEIRRKRAEHGLNSEQGGSGEGVGGEEAQSSEDETVLAMNQEDEAGFQGAVQDVVGNGEG